MVNEIPLPQELVDMILAYWSPIPIVMVQSSIPINRYGEPNWTSKGHWAVDWATSRDVISKGWCEPECLFLLPAAFKQGKCYEFPNVSFTEKGMMYSGMDREKTTVERWVVDFRCPGLLGLDKASLDTWFCLCEQDICGDEWDRKETILQKKRRGDKTTTECEETRPTKKGRYW